MNSGATIEEAITEWYGERCDDYEEGCPICDVWKKYDDLKAAAEKEKDDE